MRVRVSPLSVYNSLQRALRYEVKMSSQLVELEGLNRQLQVTVSAEDLQKTYQKRVADFAKNAKLKGFRPGKVPAQVIEQKFGHGLLQESAAQLIESSLKTTLSEKEIRAAEIGRAHV